MRPGLVLRDASERLAPILMTSLCTALALLPLGWCRAAFRAMTSGRRSRW